MPSRTRRRATTPSAAAAAAAALALVSACDRGSTEPDSGVTAEDGRDPARQRFPDVVAVVATFDDASETWTFDVTISSPYDSPTRYADGWRVVGPDGTVYGVHTLTHDHAAEQPFTRRQTGVRIPAGVGAVEIEGRDLANGFGGATATITLTPP